MVVVTEIPGLARFYRLTASRAGGKAGDDGSGFLAPKKPGLFCRNTFLVKRAVDIAMFVIAGLLVAWGIAAMVGDEIESGRAVQVIFGLLLAAAGVLVGLQAWHRVRR